eukprot:m.580872 g.580872  ORF g.580872 m.580872 type:complete len:617 (-) comp22325_c0_seq1:247-2097(-)
MGGKRRAIGSYEAGDTDELSFEKGEIIQVLDQDEDGWWYCRRLLNNAEGFAPKNYLSENDLPDEENLGVTSPGASTGIRAKILALQAQNAANAKSDKGSLDGLDELEVFSRKVEFQMVTGERSILASTPAKDSTPSEYANSDGCAMPGEVFNMDDEGDFGDGLDSSQHRGTSTPVDTEVGSPGADDVDSNVDENVEDSASRSDNGDCYLASESADTRAAIAIPEPDDPILRIAHGKLMRGVIDEDEYKQILIVHRKMRMLVASATDEDDAAWGGSSSTDGNSRNADVVFTAVSTYDDLDDTGSALSPAPSAQGTGDGDSGTTDDAALHVAAGTHHRPPSEPHAPTLATSAGDGAEYDLATGCNSAPGTIDVEYDLAAAADGVPEAAENAGYPLATGSDTVPGTTDVEYAVASSTVAAGHGDGKAPASTTKAAANLEYLQKMLTERGNEVADLSSEVHRLREDLVDSQAVVSLLRKQLRDTQSNVESERLATATAKQELAEHISNRPLSQCSTPTEMDYSAQAEITELKAKLAAFEQAKSDEIDAIKARHHIELKKFGSILEMLSREKRADKPGLRSMTPADTAVRRTKKKKRTLPTPPVASALLPAPPPTSGASTT